MAEFQQGIYVEPTDDSQGAFVIDCTLESLTAHSSEITSSPVESGADVTEHRRTKPAAWRFRALLTNEIDPQIAMQRSLSALDDGPDALASARERGPAVAVTRAVDELARFQRIFERSDLCRITTEVDLLPDCLLETLDYKVLSSTPDAVGVRVAPAAIEVTGVFRQVRFATTETAALPAEAVKNQTGKTKDKGKQSTKPVNQADLERSQSILHFVTGGL